VPTDVATLSVASFCFDPAGRSRNHAVVNMLARFVSVLLFCPCLLLAAGKAEHVVVVVWDGMRPDFISQEHTPTLFQLAREGVVFADHHSVYCTATGINGTAMATGAQPGRSGIIANRDYRPEISPLRPVDVQATDVVRKGDQLSHGHYVMTPTLVEMLHDTGKTTAIAGSKQVAFLHDRREHPDGFTKGVNVFYGNAIPKSVHTAITNLLGPFPPASSGRPAGPNSARDEWTTSALLGPLWSNGVPHFSLLWLSEPDVSLHAAGPGSARALAALESSDRQLARVLNALEKRGVRGKTDVLVVSDHGFSTIHKPVDVVKTLRDAGFSAHREFTSEPRDGDILCIGQGGSVLFYIHGRERETIRRLVEFLQQQEFSGVLLTREPMEGTFTLEQANIASRHAPDVALSMRWSSDKNTNGIAGLAYSDGGRAGLGHHASLSRFDVNNLLVAAGPDFKKGATNSMPSSNIDLAPTVLWLLTGTTPNTMDGRVLSEALVVDAPATPQVVTERLEAQRTNGPVIWRQYLKISTVGRTVYLDEGNGSTTHLDVPTQSH
jgi:arylsulfatase A-like enzyme